MNWKALLLLLAFYLSFALALDASGQTLELLNVSYDPTREFYTAFNAAFVQHWKATSDQSLAIRMSHGGSGKQARAVLDGLQADVVTLALGHDIDALATAGLVASNWSQRLPHQACPYFSTIVFLVRKGNPKNIRNWDDLVRPNVSVIIPNPKTSGAARWAYLAAWAHASRTAPPNDATYPERFMKRLFQNVPVLDSGARGATITFTQRLIGDVLVSWENEAYLAINECGDRVAIVHPPTSILAEPPVAVVDAVVDRRGTRAVASAYLEFLYTDEAQELAARHYYRPRSEAVAARYTDRFPPISLISIQELGGWPAVHARHFAEGGLFDQIVTAR